MSKDKDLAKELLKWYNDLLAWRKANRDDDYQTISQYCLPQESDITTTKTEGIAGWTDRIFDTTMIQACQTLAAGLFNWWTPPGQPWGEYDVPDELKTDGRDVDEAVKFCGTSSDKFMKALQRSNFYPVKSMGDTGLGAFATDLIIFDEDDSGDLFNFTHHQIGTYVIEDNYKGLVDRTGTEREMTFRQIEQKFSKKGDTIPEKMVKAGKANRSKKFKILHCILPREDSERLPDRRDGPNKPIASVYIAMDFQETMRVSGYDESPILCRRFKKWVSAYGYGPGFLALPDARQVNYVQQYLDALAELHAYPRILIPDNLEGDVDLRAGGATTWDTSNPEGKPAEWASIGDYKLGLEMQQGRRQAIQDAFYVSAFKLLNSQPLLDKDMTAYEISQRQAEQLQNMAAVDARHIVEFHNPLMKRGFGIMFRAGKIGQPPNSLMQDLGGGKKALVMPDVLATSRFNDELKALKNRGIVQSFQTLQPLLDSPAVQPLGLLDNLIMDDTVRDLFRNNGISADLLRETGFMGKPPTVQALRAQRAALAQQQRQAQMAETLGKAGKGLGGSPEWMQDAVKDQATGGGKKAAA